TPHYLPKVREFVLVKPHHVIAPGSSKNISKELYASNDMAHNYYLEEAKKKTQDKKRNLKPKEMPSARTHHTPNTCIPKPRSNNQTSRKFPTSKSSEEMLKAVQKVDHSRNPSLFLDSNTLWVLTRKTFTSSTTKVDYEPPNGSNEDITNPYECDQTLNVSADVVAPTAVDLADLPVSTSIDQDAPSTSIQLTQDQEHSPIISQGDKYASSNFCDIPLTKSYIPKVSETPDISLTIANFYKPIEDLCIYEGRVVDQLYYTSHHIDRCFSNVRLNCLYKISELIVPRFILDFYSQVTLQREESGHILISFMIQTNSSLFLSYNLAKFSKFPTMVKPFERVDLNRTIKNKFVTLTPNQVLTKKVREDLKRWEKLIRENVFSLGAHHSYGMFLTRLFRYVMEHYPHLDNGIYNIVDRFMHPLALKQTRKPRSDRGMPKARQSVSSSTHHYGSSSRHEDDDKDDGTFRASSPSPTTFLNSHSSLNYQKYDIPTFSQQDNDLLFERQTNLLNQMQKMHEEFRGGFKSFGKALKGVFSKKKK
nr:hypothetical protein [Tanacetum cinerariifolium]